MANEISVVDQREIENSIFTVKGVQVMLDSDLAELYGVEIKRLNEQVKRNIDRFPEQFMFQLTESDWDFIKIQNGFYSHASNLRSQIATSSSKHGGRRYLPYAFTEQGVAMLSSVLRSETAVKVSIQIMNAFVELRKLVLNNAGIFQRLDKMEMKQLEADQKFEQIFKALESKNEQIEKGIFFEGQVFDAYVFVAGLIKKAESSIVLIDNYIDDSVLVLLSKRKKSANATIYTRQINQQLKLDLQKHQVQYPAIKVKILADCHDRFLIIDNHELYHIGASLKDLGKKWFAFSKMDSLIIDVLNKLK